MRKENVMSKMYAIVDLEATGVKSGNPGHIIQIGITFVDDAVIHDTIALDVKPPCKIDTHVQELTGITNERVLRAPYFEEIAEYIFTVLDGCVFVAHNVAFDYTLLKEEFRRAGYSHFDMQTIDTIELAKIICPLEKSYGLKNMTEERAIFNAQLHDAGSDSRATAELFLWLKNKTIQLPKGLGYRIRQLLDSKEDAYVQLFASFVQFEEWVLPPKALDVNARFGQMYAGNVLREQKIYRHDSVLDLLNEINETRQLILVEDASAAMDVPGERILSPRDFLNPDALEWCFVNLTQLTQHEVRQLCSVLVWSQYTQTYALEELNQVTAKMKERLAFTVPGKEVSPYFKNHVIQSVDKEVIILTYHDFVSYYDMYRHYLLFQKRVLVVHQIYEYIKTIQHMMAQHIEIYQLVSYAHQLKQMLERQGSNTTDILFVETVIEGYQQVLEQLSKAYPKVFEQLVQNDTGSYSSFLDKKSQFPHVLLQQLSQHTHTLLEVLTRYPLEKWQVFRFVSRQEQLLTEILQTQKETDYLAIVCQKMTKGKWLTLVHGQYTCFSWLTGTVYVDFETVYYGSMLWRDNLSQTYLQFLLGDDNLVFNQEVSRQSRLVRQVSIVNDFPVSDMKENLLVKKLLKMFDRLSQMTLFVVPNKQMIQKLKEANESVMGIDVFSNKKQLEIMKNNPVPVVITWQQLLQYGRMSEVKCAVFVKLPFDSPDSLEAQASRHFLSGEQHYFQTIALPNMLMHLRKMFQQVKNAQVYVLDSRMIKSQYAEEISEVFSDLQLNQLTKTEMIERL